mgnify:FL=1
MKNFILIYFLGLFFALAQKKTINFYKEAERINLYSNVIPCKSNLETLVDYNSTGRTFKKIANPEIWPFPAKQIN